MSKEVRTPEEAEELQKVLKNLRRGDPITDNELKKSIPFLNRLEQDLRVLGSEHELSRRNVAEMLRQLEDFETLRKRGW